MQNKYIFNYPVEFVTLEDYSAHRNKEVVILRELIDGDEYDYEGEKMFLIQCVEDGWEGHALECELTPVQ